MSYTHRDLCKFATSWLLKQSWCDMACWELGYYRGYVDSVGISKPKSKYHRVTVVEVKRTRSDLLSDLRSGKYLKYEKGSTHCYLAATPEALGFPKNTRKLVIKDLEARGFPSHWGILLFGPRGGITVFRPARKHAITNSVRIRSLTRKIAKSLVYRALKGTL